MAVESCNSPTVVGFAGGFGYYRVYSVSGKGLVECFESSANENGEVTTDWSAHKTSRGFDTEQEAWQYVGEQLGWIEKEVVPALPSVEDMQLATLKEGYQFQETVFNDGSFNNCVIWFTKDKSHDALRAGKATCGWGRYERRSAWMMAYEALVITKEKT